MLPRDLTRFPGVRKAMDVIARAWHSGGMVRHKIRPRAAVAAALIYALAVQGVLVAWLTAVQAAPSAPGGALTQLCRSIGSGQDHPASDPAAALHCLTLCATIHISASGPLPAVAARASDPDRASVAISFVSAHTDVPARLRDATLGARGPPRQG
jgi:hypothetical protein